MVQRLNEVGAARGHYQMAMVEAVGVACRDAEAASVVVAVAVVAVVAAVAAAAAAAAAAAISVSFAHTIQHA
jgi:hypothetical protein